MREDRLLLEQQLWKPPRGSIERAEAEVEAGVAAEAQAATPATAPVQYRAHRLREEASLATRQAEVRNGGPDSLLAP